MSKHGYPSCLTVFNFLWQMRYETWANRFSTSEFQCHNIIWLQVMTGQMSVIDLFEVSLLASLLYSQGSLAYTQMSNYKHLMSKYILHLKTSTQHKTCKTQFFHCLLPLIRCSFRLHFYYVQQFHTNMFGILLRH